MTPPNTTTDQATWYEAQTGNHQGLICEESTGKNIAVTYEKEHATLIVIAVNQHAALVACAEAARESNLILHHALTWEDMTPSLRHRLTEASNRLEAALAQLAAVKEEK